MKLANRVVIAVSFAVLPLAAAAEDLFQVYRDAHGYDAQFAAAQYALQAGREKLPQGRALVLPTIGLSGTASQTRNDFDSDVPNLIPSFRRSSDSYGYTLSFSQPLFRRQNFLAYDQAEYQVKLAEAAFGQAAEDLITRAAQGYFDVLAAFDTLALVRAQKAATSEQLAQAKRNFEVGTSTITDTHEAQARYDLILAQEIAAQNDLENKKQTLQQLTGKAYAALKPLRADVSLSPPNPNNMLTWSELAEKQSFAVLSQEAQAEIAKLSAKSATAGHYPTLDLVASHAYSNQSNTLSSPFGFNNNASTIGLQAAVPLYQGGAITSREREAAANYEKAKQDLETARRGSALASRQSFLAVINGIAQVQALEQALVSSQSALESNKLGYEVGVRINIDVLNAQQQLFSTRRDLALARYNTILSHLRLKSAAGSLREPDLKEVNNALAR